MGATRKNLHLVRNGSGKGQYVVRRSNKPRVEMAMGRYKHAVQMAEDVHFPQRVLLYDFYTEAMRDEHLRSQVRIWHEKVLAEPFVFIDTTKEVGGRFDEDTHALLHTAWVFEFLKFAMDSILWGHSLIEFDPDKEDGGAFKKVCLVWREHVRPEDGVITPERGGLDGVPFREGELTNWMIEVGDKYSLGLLDSLTRTVIKKEYTSTDWMRRNERYGQPLLAIRTDSDDEVELQKKEDMAAQFGGSGYVILDSEDEIEIKESAQAFAYQTFKDFLKVMDEYISKLLNGAVLGEASDAGSRSKEEVGERTMDTIKLATMRFLEFVVNGQLVPFLRLHGYSIPENQRFAFWATTEEGKQIAREERMGGAAKDVDPETGVEKRGEKVQEDDAQLVKKKASPFRMTSSGGKR